MQKITIIFFVMSDKTYPSGKELRERMYNHQKREEKQEQLRKEKLMINIEKELNRVLTTDVYFESNKGNSSTPFYSDNKPKINNYTNCKYLEDFIQNFNKHKTLNGIKLDGIRLEYKITKKYCVGSVVWN